MSSGPVLRHGHRAAAVGLLALACIALGATDSRATRPMLGAIASSPPLRVVGLGDSVPAGSACGCAGFVQDAGDTLARERDRSAQVTNAAVGGYTSTDVLRQLDDPDVRRDIASADVVVVEVGANDFDEQRVYDPGCLDAPSSGCFDPAVAAMSANITKIVRTTRALNPTTRIVLVGYWNVFRDGDVAAAEGPTYVNASDSLTKWVNTTVRRVASIQGAVYVDAYSALKGTEGDADDTNYLAGDGDHPNAGGHALLAAAVVDAVDGR